MSGRDLLHSTPEWVEGLERVYGDKYAAAMLAAYPYGTVLGKESVVIPLSELSTRERELLAKRFVYTSRTATEHEYRCRRCGWLSAVWGNRAAAAETALSHALDCRP